MAFDRVLAAAAIIAMAHVPASAAETTGGWRLLRTPNPYGGADAVSITHTAELARSDPDFTRGRPLARSASAAVPAAAELG